MRTRSFLSTMRSTSPKHKQRQPVARKDPDCQSHAIRKGILKRGWHCKQAAKLVRLLLAKCPRRIICAARPVRRVTFCTDVRITEYRRRLDGSGGVPTDGTLVPLGLGRRARLTRAPLAPSQERPSAHVTWLSSNERLRLLRRSMGGASYVHAWVRQRREVAQLQRLREQSRRDPKDQQLMPVSAEEARRRALDLERESGLVTFGDCQLKSGCGRSAAGIPWPSK